LNVKESLGIYLFTVYRLCLRYGDQSLYTVFQKQYTTDKLFILEEFMSG